MRRGDGGGGGSMGGCSTSSFTPRTGNLPDVHWRAISMSHLRCHPNFRPLPPPSMIGSLPTREHVRYFRQDSWQWDYLHVGRCTTSQCSSALGFLEPRAANFLGIPKSLQRGGTSAWDRLRQIPTGDQSLRGLERTLCERGRENDDDDDDDDDRREYVWSSWRPGSREIDRLWIPASIMRVDDNSIRSSRPYPFAAKYIPSLTRDDLYRRKMHMSDDHASSSSPILRTRMQWGNAQEATSILTALNYFCGLDNETVIREVGMCGAMFDGEGMGDPLLHGVKIGASPDAIICHGNGTVEVLEVKNHCPFVWNRISHTGNSVRHANGHRRQRGARRKEQLGGNGDEHTRESVRLPKHFLIRDFELERQVPPVYLPQLMMEMLCIGNSVNLDDRPPDVTSSPICTSAIMVRQTATKGAILLRLRRDEEWMDEMKYWLGQFQMRYVETNKIPDDNFFWNDDPCSRYRMFLSRTKELSEKVEFVAYIDHGRIQRMLMERGVGGGEAPLFLDRVDDNDG
ncbi:hypothetical protein ACHAXA_001286 [Cyclostephanos tholiformis]|uniref:YqaJ viral recombinase domain-containing protein n=1 Tax=Cyclostephanos tholiformis TaxID=382380 RepID=A0ABD3R9G3_9STRA